MVEPVLAPRLEGSPEWPGVGVFFGMPDAVYHSIHACSASGLKKMLASSMDYWACSVLNADREDDDTIFKALGRAYHVRILMGSVVFFEDYAPTLEASDFGDVKIHVTVDHIREAIRELGGTPKGQKKGPLIDQLLDLDPEAIVWDREVEGHAKLNEGKILIPFKAIKRIETAAAMIELDPVLSKAFTGGHPEVALFWYDPLTGAPMKCKVDYLKMNIFSDLKSFGNPMGRPVERAIDFAIGNQKYYLPVVIYLQGIEEVKRLVREVGRRAVWGWDPELGEAFSHAEGDYGMDKTTFSWVWQWAHQPEPQALFVFQQTGQAPVTRGRYMGKGSVFRQTELKIEKLKRKWVQCALTYGTLPWVDSAPVSHTNDDDIPLSGTDFGGEE